MKASMCNQLRLLRITTGILSSMLAPNSILQDQIARSLGLCLATVLETFAILNDSDAGTTERNSLYYSQRTVVFWLPTSLAGLDYLRALLVNTIIHASSCIRFIFEICSSSLPNVLWNSSAQNYRAVTEDRINSRITAANEKCSTPCNIFEHAFTPARRVTIPSTGARHMKLIEYFLRLFVLLCSWTNLLNAHSHIISEQSKETINVSFLPSPNPFKSCNIESLGRNVWLPSLWD